MKWNPNTGFEIEAPVDRVGPALKSFGFGGGGIIRQESVRTIRASTADFTGKNRGSWVAVPDVVMQDNYGIALQNRLSAKVSKAIFSERLPKAVGNSEEWRVTSLFLLTGRPVLPESVTREIRFATVTEGSRSRSGLSCALPDGATIDGRLVEERYFVLEFRLPKANWSKTDAWNYSQVVGDALSIMLGQEVRQLFREVERPPRIYREMRRTDEVLDLGPFAPMGISPFFDKNKFELLVQLLASGSTEAEVCRKMFYQMVEAVRQRTLRARSLLLSTIMEAALRTIYNEPFGTTRKGLKAHRLLEKFRRDYLGEEWKETCSRVKRTFFILRDRNAHPDWLRTEEGSLSDKVKEANYHDLVFMSRFYGSMIGAIAGFRDLDPRIEI